MLSQLIPFLRLLTSGTGHRARDCTEHAIGLEYVVRLARSTDTIATSLAPRLLVGWDRIDVQTHQMSTTISNLLRYLRKNLAQNMKRACWYFVEGKQAHHTPIPCGGQEAAGKDGSVSRKDNSKGVQSSASQGRSGHKVVQERLRPRCRFREWYVDP